MYSEWRSARNSLPQFETIVADLDNVFSLTVENLNFALCHFMTEIRKLNGCEFPSKTMYDIIICIQFYLGAFGFNWKLVDDVYFQDVKFTLDNLMKDRCVLSFSEEDILWNGGYLGCTNPEQLLNMVVFVLGLLIPYEV